MGWYGPLTHRQFLVWQVWLRNQWNQPSRSDFYTMQLTAMQSAKEDVNPSDFVITFKDVESTTALPSQPEEDNRPIVDGKPFGPRRLTKEDVTRLNAQHRMAQIEQHYKGNKPGDVTLKSDKVTLDDVRKNKGVP